MKTIGLYEAKTHFSRLMEEVARGEPVIVTRHGTPIVRLVPVREREKPDVQAAIDALIEFGKRHPRRGFTIRELREEGRRF